MSVGLIVGETLGLSVGEALGSKVGDVVGNNDGLAVGDAVFLPPLLLGGGLSLFDILESLLFDIFPDLLLARVGENVGVALGLTVLDI